MEQHPTLHDEDRPSQREVLRSPAWWDQQVIEEPTVEEKSENKLDWSLLLQAAADERLNTLDWQVLAMCHNEGILSPTAIAHRLGQTRNTIHSRLRKIAKVLQGA